MPKVVEVGHKRLRECAKSWASVPKAEKVCLNLREYAISWDSGQKFAKSWESVPKVEKVWKSLGMYENVLNLPMK